MAVIEYTALLDSTLAGCTDIDRDVRKSVGTNGSDDIQGRDVDTTGSSPSKTAMSRQAGNDKIFGDEGGIVVCISGSDGCPQSIAARMNAGAILPSDDSVEEPGADKFYVEAGNDDIRANEDLVACGPGTDTTFVNECLDKVESREEEINPRSRPPHAKPEPTQPVNAGP